MRSTLLVAVAVTVAMGCQTSPRISSHIEMLNSEKRILEDELYELEYDYEDALAKIDQLRAENERLYQRLGTPLEARPATEPRRRDTTKKSRSNLNLAPPMIDEGSIEPNIEIPDQQPTPRGVPNSKPGPVAPAVPMSLLAPPGAADEKGPDLLSLAAPQREEKQTSYVASPPERLPLDPSDPRITQLYLDPLLTGGSDFDRQPGDDGIVVALEPRNQENRFVPLAGPISVVLVDPTLEPDSARIARWDLEAQDVEQVIKASPAEPGIRLKLPWSSGPPQNNRLQLFVRYVTVDGRKLESSREIFVTLPGQFSQRWTPRSSGRTRTLATTETTKHRDPHEAAQGLSIPGEPATPTDVQPASHAEEVEAALDQRSSSATAVHASPQWQPQR